MRIVRLYTKDESYGRSLRHFRWTRDLGVGMRIEFDEDGFEAANDVLSIRWHRHCAVGEGDLER